MNRGKIIIEKLEVFAYHGVMDFEKKDGQNFYIDGTLTIDMVSPGISDDLEDTVNYAQVCSDITKYLQKNRFDLIEAVAYGTAKMILTSYPKVSEVEITIHKPSAPIGLPFEDVAVSISMKWNKAFLSIGSNIGDSEGYLNQAVDAIYDDDNCRVIAVSDYVITKPYGPVVQDDFLNGCVEIDTLYTPEQLLVAVNNIEKEAGRTREIHWGPRTLDVDILLYNNDMVCNSDLIIPHKEMHKRAFVLVPLAQIAPYALHPAFNKTITVLLEELREIEQIQGFSTDGNGCEGCCGCSKNKASRDE